MKSIVPSQDTLSFLLYYKLRCLKNSRPVSVSTQTNSSSGRIILHMSNKLRNGLLILGIRLGGSPAEELNEVQDQRQGCSWGGQTFSILSSSLTIPLYFLSSLTLLRSLHLQSASLHSDLL